MPKVRSSAASGSGRVIVAAGLLMTALLLMTAVPPAPAQKDMRGDAILPNPEPFSLNAYDAVSAVALIERAGFLQLWDGSGLPETVAVTEAEAVYIGTDEEAVPAQRNRYDIVVNGELLDWQRTYVEYGGRMVSVRLLFTYRNQHPPAYLRYMITPDLSGD